jgi:eukaryotic-like serine/threonine-protein kinase
MGASHLPTVRRSGTRERPTEVAGNPTSAGAGASASAGEPSLVLERYRLHRRLGSGAFGTVWMARDERLDREVALKIVPRERVVGGRFEREARAAARLSHPGIVTLYEAALDDHGAYLVSELVRGSTLGQLLEAGRLSDQDILAISLALCEALSHAHAQGIVHRDVKPSNVLIPKRPSSRAHPAKVTDFGVARVIGGDSLTGTGDVVGTAAYMAPEQAEGLEVGACADLYSLALVTYEALTGVNPVRIATAAPAARRLGAHLPPLRRQRRDLPRELGRGIDLALRPRPRERGTLDELHESLAVALEHVGDTPGIVAQPWKPSIRSRGVERDEALAASTGADALPPAPNPFAPPADPLEHPGTQALAPGPRWPARAVAATAAAATTGWLAAHLLAHGTIAPAVAAMVAWLLALVLPRIGWFALSTGLVCTAIVQQRPGGALVLLIAALAPVLLLPRRGAMWPLCAAAPALGALGLAGAWPAIVPRLSASAWRRAALASIGWLWLVLAAPLAGVDLYTRRPPVSPPPEVWIASLSVTVHHVLGPILSSGVLAGAAVWALAAVVLPWLVRGRSLALDLVLATVWAAATVSATEVAISKFHRADGVSVPASAAAGAVASAALALSPAVMKAWQARPRRSNPHPELP